MIVWILLAVFVLIVVLLKWYRDKRVLFSVVFCILLVVMNTVATSRTYKSNKSTEAHPLSEWKVSKHDNDYHFVNGNDDFIVDKSKVVVYDAEKEDEEVIEIYYETREYSSLAPNILYKMYHLADSTTETTRIVNNVNISATKDHQSKL